MSNPINDDGASSVGADPGSEQLRFTDEQFIWRFSPNQTNPELLEAIFVGRKPLLQNVLEKIADAATSGSTHHVLLYGPRGIGKSHFASLLHHRLLKDKELSETVHIAHLNEDETTTSMVQLLVRIYRSLCKAYPDSYSLAWLDELINQPTGEIAEVLTRRLVVRFEKRTMIILVENLNLLFENLGKDGQHELRTFLQEHPFACVIATSQQLFKAVNDRSEPFFGFFQQIPLKPLSLPDAQTLLAKIARAKGQDELAGFLNTPDGRGRVRAIHDLAGGNHRVYIVLSGFATRESLDQLVAPFQKMADDLTPYYQERLRWISPLQRQIVELLCREHGTLNPKEIARRLLGDQNSIGKQVRELTKIGYLTSTKRGRETFYELSEPLMRLAYEVKEQSLLEMLVEFLRIWYRPDQIQQLQNDSLSPSTQAYVSAAYERSQTHPDPRLKLLLKEIFKAATERGNKEQAMLWEEYAAASDTAGAWLQAGYCYSEINKEHEKAIDCYTQTLEIAPDDAVAWSNKGVSLKNLGQNEEALNCYDKAIELDSENAGAWNNKGLVLDALGRFEEALKCLNQSLKLDPKLGFAWNNKGNSLKNVDRHVEAVACYDKAIGIDPEDPCPWNGKGKVMHELDQYENALTYYAKALSLNSEFILAWKNKGNTLKKLGRHLEAQSCFDELTKLDPESTNAWVSKGSSCGDLEQYEQALNCYSRALELDPEHGTAWNNRGTAMDNLGQHEEALACYDKAIAVDPESAYPRFNRSETFFSLHRWDEGFDAIQDALVHSTGVTDYLGDASSIFFLVFRLSEDKHLLQSRIDTLVDLYEQAANGSLRETPDDGEDLAQQTPIGAISPLSHLADGLVKSLSKIGSIRVAPEIMEGFVTAVEQRVAHLSEFEIPLRLFRYGIRYLVSKRESEFVELIKPERRILRQALGLELEEPTR